MLLSDCHLAPAVLPLLGRLLDRLAAAPQQPGFRLWLSSPHTAVFPMALLERAVKVAAPQPQARPCATTVIAVS